MKRWLFLVAVLTSGCGSLDKPPLPEFAIGEAPPQRTAEDPALTRLRAADVVYFCLTKKNAAQNEQTWKVIAALQNSGSTVALGWSQIAAGRQPLLDGWQREELSTAELLGQLSVPERSDWMNTGLRPGLLQVALGSPLELLHKLRKGETLTTAERALLPRDFRPRPQAPDDFADRISALPGLRRYNFAALFRAHLAAEQILAENIVRFQRAQAETKLLVFLPDDVLIDPREVTDFVAQKLNVRQMIIDRSAPTPEARSPLLAAR